MFIFANNAASCLFAPIEALDTELTINSADEDKFPQPAYGEQFAITLQHPTTGEREIMYVIERADDIFTVLRGQEGTVAQAFPVNTVVAHNITAGVLEFLRDLQGG
jgi:hypothetical protein